MVEKVKMNATDLPENELNGIEGKSKEWILQIKRMFVTNDMTC